MKNKKKLEALLNIGVNVLASLFVAIFVMPIGEGFAFIAAVVTFTSLQTIYYNNVNLRELKNEIRSIKRERPKKNPKRSK